MHHIDPHLIGKDEWIACVDGHVDNLKFGLNYQCFRNMRTLLLDRPIQSVRHFFSRTHCRFWQEYSPKTATWRRMVAWDKRPGVHAVRTLRVGVPGAASVVAQLVATSGRRGRSPSVSRPRSGAGCCAGLFWDRAQPSSLRSRGWRGSESCGPCSWCARR